MPNKKEPENREDIDFYYRQAVIELSRSNDRRFARMVSRTIAACIFIAALAEALLAP